MDQLNAFMADMPGWLAALITIGVGWVVAIIARMVVAGTINRTPLGAKAKTTGGNIGKAIGKAVFWLVLLFFLMLSLGYLNMGQFTQPIEELYNSLLGFAPKLLGAGFAFFIGWILARVAQNAVTSTLQAAQLDNLASRSGLTSATGSTGSLSKGLGTLVFVLIIVPVAIAALGILDISAISQPLTDMLQGFLDYIPALIGAGIVLGLAIFIGRFVANFVKGFLPTLGFDNSVNTLMAIDDGEGLSISPSSIAGNLAFLIIAILGLTASLDILGIDFLTATFDDIVAFGGQLLRAAVLIMIGVFLANFIARIMAGVISPKIAELFKYVAMLIFIFLGLSSLDPAGDIIPTAFGALVVGSAVAGALAFGIGGRAWAGNVLERMFPPKNIGSAAPKPAAKKTPRS
jgi:hypothetical protein